MGDEMDGWQVMLFENSKNPELEQTEDLDEKLQNYKWNLELAKSLKDQYDWIVGNHNGFIYDESYLDDFLGMIDGVYTGNTTVCEKLEHPFVEMDPGAETLCRIRYKKASAFVRKALLEQIYGKR